MIKITFCLLNKIVSESFIFEKISFDIFTNIIVPKLDFHIFVL